MRQRKESKTTAISSKCDAQAKEYIKSHDLSHNQEERKSQNMKDLTLMITIARRDDEDDYSRFFEEHSIPTVFSSRCDGTTSSERLDLFGIEHTEKTVYFLVASGDKTRELMKKLRSEMYIDLPDRGIAFASPLTCISGASALEALTQGEINEKETTNMNTENELIVIIANKGSTDIIMDAARSVGASGGTVLHTKGTAGVGAKKFFGLSIAEEKEMIFIVAKNSDRNPIIKAVMASCGAGTPQEAVAFSLPISEAAGFKSFDEQ